MSLGRHSRRVAGAVATVAGLSVAFLLAGCSSSGGPAATKSAAPTPTAMPTFVAGGSADQNTDFFRYLVSDAIAHEGDNASTQALAQKLAASGFDAKGIEFSDNATAIGLKPDSVTVAATLKDQCLIAQFGPSIGGLTVSVQPVLASGGCLLGRSINHL
jgi:hypothetical protein